MQLIGAALATLITYIVLMIVLMKISFMHLKFRIDIITLVKIMVASAGMFFALRSFTFESGIIWLILQVLLGVAIFVILMILFDNNFRGIFQAVLKHYEK